MSYFIFKFDKKVLKANLSTFLKGCYKELKASYNSVKDVMMVYFVVHAVCSALMITAFVRHCCATSLLATQRSDYSLDVETLSMLELTPTPQIPTKKIIL